MKSSELYSGRSVLKITTGDIYGNVGDSDKLRSCQSKRKGGIKMFAIFKRELKAYFTSPLGYVFLAIFYAFSDCSFISSPLSVGSTDISSVFR